MQSSGVPLTHATTGNIPIGWACDNEDTVSEAYAICCSLS